MSFLNNFLCPGFRLCELTSCCNRQPTIFALINYRPTIIILKTPPMKKTTFTLSVIFLAALFFASCSNLKNFSIEKRHYGKGYYVNANGKRDVKAESNAKEVAALNETQNAVAVQEEIAAVKTPVAKVEIAPVAEKPVAKTAVAPKQNHVTTRPAVADQKTTTSEEQKAIRSITKNKTQPSASDDVSAILLVLLCILLPPLAVYLVDGIGTSFWIDLILCLLFFLPGIIYAFIVCFA
jgi:uncharacterized membrane protein YqaE (UPF0057 family)